MLYRKGNLWEAEGYRKVITTNIGWDSQGRNNMGAGTALQAARQWPWLPSWYGHGCAILGASMPVVDTATLWGLIKHTRADEGDFRSAEKSSRELIFFPVKPLKSLTPADSWNQLASLRLIRRSAVELSMMCGKIALTLPGAGNGGLDPMLVFLVIARYLKSDRFLLVDSRDDWEPFSGNHPFSVSRG